MTILTIISLIIAATISSIQFFVERGKNSKTKNTLIILTSVFLIFSIASELVKYFNDLEDADKRESEYKSIINRADSTLLKVDSNLYVSDSILKNTNNSILSLNQLQKISKDINDSMADELASQRQTTIISNNLLSKSQIILLKQKEALLKNEKLQNNQNELLSISLMNKLIVPKVRIVFSYKNPINSGGFIWPKFSTSSMYPEVMEWGRGVKADNFFPNYMHLGNDRKGYIMNLRLFVKGFVDKNVIVNDDVTGIITNRYTEKNGRFCTAFEFNLDKKMNLSHFYNEVKNVASEISLVKNYTYNISKEVVDSNENKFINQDIDVYLEAPLDISTGTWFKITLKQVGKYQAEKITYGDFIYYSIKYKWVVDKSVESLIIYNDQ